MNIYHQFFLVLVEGDPRLRRYALKDAHAMYTGLYVIAATAHFNGRLANRLLLDCGIHSFRGNRVVSFQLAVTTKKLQKNYLLLPFGLDFAIIQMSLVGELFCRKPRYIRGFLRYSYML